MEYKIRNAKDLLGMQLKEFSENAAVQNYTDNVRVMENAIDTVDMYDNFDELKIKPEQYSRLEEDDVYGIPFIEEIHVQEDAPRILPWQRNAAAQFLKDLRGFGLLADVVGSGKTYEAGVVLSELVYRGEVGSMLIVTPGELITNWTRVIERDFGLGVGMLHVITQMSELALDEEGRPRHPAIVSLDDFRGWVDHDRGASFAARNAFDLIIVDEAHKLCESNNTCVMSCLSKTIAQSTMLGKKNVYCLLLSATPHDGDLASMFDLWYFIHTRGGDPYGIGEAERAEQKKNYIEHEWFKAENVSDFIRKYKLSLFNPSKEGIKSDFRIKLDQYYQSKGQEIEYDKLTEWAKERKLEAFFEDEEYHVKSEDEWADVDVAEGPRVKADVDRRIADTYIATLRKIMVRQSKRNGEFNAVDRSANQSKSNLMKGKKTVNAFFYPVDQKGLRLENLLYENSEFSLVYDKLDFPNDYFPKVKLKTGELQRLDDFLYRRRASMTKYAQDVIPQILDRLEPYVRGNFLEGYRNYFSEMFTSQEDIKENIAYEKKGTYNLVLPYTGDSFENKMHALESILAKHNKERVLVFFDYELDANKEKVFEDGTVEDCLYDKVQKRLEKMQDKRKLIVLEKKKEEDGKVSGALDEQILAEFNDELNYNCILLIKTDGYTHGANLQKASVIVNFQVSCDPIDMEQKIGRIFRLGQSNDVTIYSLADMNQLEGYALAYFSYIGLFDVDNGDATILAGSNKTQMVTVRCDYCQNADIMPREEYDAWASEIAVDPDTEEKPRRLRYFSEDYKYGYVSRDGDSDVTTIELADYPNLVEHLQDNRLICRNSHKGNLYICNQVASNVFVCDTNSEHQFRRAERAGEGYLCMNGAAGMPMCSKVGERGVYYCDKLCVVYHCREHKRAFPNCRLHRLTVSELRKIISNVGTYVSVVDTMCSDCPDKEKCKQGVTHTQSCCPMGQDTGAGCLSCLVLKGKKANSDCTRPGPHKLRFDENWTANCPRCKGKLRSKELSRFSDHIRYLWETSTAQDSFCDLLRKEAINVKELKDILEGSTSR